MANHRAAQLSSSGRFVSSAAKRLLPARIFARLAVPALALGLFATDLAGQADTTTGNEPPPPVRQAPTPPQVPDSIQELVREFQQLQGRLASLQEQAIEESEELQEQRASVQESIEEAMLETNPALEEDLSRVESLQQEMDEARQAQDQQRMMSLSMEASELRNRLQSAQADVMERPAVQEEIESFQNNLLEQMASIEPETEAMIAQLEELNRRFREFQESRVNGGAGAPQP